MKSARKAPLQEILSRAIRLLQFISTRRFGVTIAELADEVGVTKRQAQRYLNALKEAGVRIAKYQSYEKYGRKARWKIVDQQEFFKHIGIL